MVAISQADFEAAVQPDAAASPDTTQAGEAMAAPAGHSDSTSDDHTSLEMDFMATANLNRTDDFGNVIAGPAIDANGVKLASEVLKAPSRAFDGLTVTLQNVCYSVRVNDKERSTRFRKHKTDKVLLDEVSCSFVPGRLVALMGSSGAGKTTLMDLVAGRKNQGTVEGHLLFDGQPRPDYFKRIAGMHRAAALTRRRSCLNIRMRARTLGP